MPAKGHGTDSAKPTKRTRKYHQARMVRELGECVIISYANDRRDLTGRICGDPMPDHRVYRERLEQWKGEINTRENSEDS